MAKKYARGLDAWGICGRSGRKMLLRNMVFDGRYPNMRVDPAWFEPKDPLDYAPKVDDPIALWRPAPDNVPIPVTLTTGGFIGENMSLSWTAGTPVAQIAQYILYSRDEEDEPWVEYGIYIPTYDSFGGTVNAANTASIPIGLFANLWRVIAQDADGNSGADVLELGDLGYTVSFHVLGGNGSNSVHVYGTEASSLRESYPGDAVASDEADPNTGMFYEQANAANVRYGPINADAAGGGTGTTPYLNATYTPARTGQAILGNGFNPVYEYMWSLQDVFDGLTNKPDFYYATSAGNFIPLAPDTPKNGRGFRIIVWMDELGRLYVMESSNAGGGVSQIKRFTSPGVAATIGTTYPDPNFVFTTGQGRNNRFYGYGERFIPELGYLYVPRLATQVNDSANFPYRVPFSSSANLNTPLVGQQMTIINGATTFVYSPTLGILVAGINSAYNATGKNPGWSTDGGLTWTLGTDISGGPFLTRCPFITWHPEIGAFIATSEQITNNGQVAYISEDGKNWIMLGRFFGSLTGGTHCHVLYQQFQVQPITPVYPTLDPLVGTLSAGTANLSNGNMTATTVQSSAGTRMSQYSRYKGKWYWEVAATSGSTFVDLRCGITRRGFGVDVAAGFVSAPAGPAFISFQPTANWNVFNLSSVGASIGAGTALAIGGRMCFAMDLNANKLWVGQNGVWLNGDPVAGTGGLSIPVSNYCPTVGVSSGPVGGVSYTFCPSPTSWLYTMPAGFAAMAQQTY